MTEPVFEMLWNCSSCGTQGLLGRSQRRCPNCGAPQDPTKRYFPKPGEAVEVRGHAYAGADWACAACSTPNGAAASFCTNCGNPKDGNARVAVQADRVVKDGAVVAPATQPTSAAPRAAKSGAARVVGALLVGVVVLLVVMFVWKKDVTVDVTAHRWTREVDVERYDAVREDAWCDQLPGGAYGVTRTRDVRDHKQVADGQDCHDRHVDKGDGTFTVKQECTTKYRSEPVYDDKCHYSVDRWHVVRTDTADGELAQTPTWPTPRLASGSGRGAERAGGRRERYVVVLRDARAGETHECALPEARWRAIPDGSRHTMKVRMTGGAVCDSLR